MSKLGIKIGYIILGITAILILILYFLPTNGDAWDNIGKHAFFIGFILPLYIVISVIYSIYVMRKYANNDFKSKRRKK